MSAGTYCYVVLCRRGRLSARRFGAHRGRRGAGAYCGSRPPTACYECVCACVTYNKGYLLTYLLTSNDNDVTDRAADSSRCMGLCAHNMCRPTCRTRTRAVCKRLRRNNGHLTLQIWTHLRYPVCGEMYEAFLKASSGAKYSFRIKSRTGENTRKFSTEQNCPEF